VREKEQEASWDNFSQILILYSQKRSKTKEPPKNEEKMRRGGEALVKLLLLLQPVRSLLLWLRTLLLTSVRVFLVKNRNIFKTKGSEKMMMMIPVVGFTAKDDNRERVSREETMCQQQLSLPQSLTSLSIFVSQNSFHFLILSHSYSFVLLSLSH
jgi:hypothetical protein